MNETHGTAETQDRACKLITCVLPDDGTHERLLTDLRVNRKALRVTTQSCLGMGVHADADAKPGTLRDAYLVRVIQIVADVGEADDLFEYIHAVAHINRPGGGVMIQQPLLSATPYRLPEGIPDE